MERINTQTHAAYETTYRGRNFIILVDMEQHLTFIYMETVSDDVYYQEDRIWTGKYGTTEETAAQEAEDYIKELFDIMEENMVRSIRYAQRHETIRGYASMFKKSMLMEKTEKIKRVQDLEVA